jgi:hypothetical protein
VVAGLECTRGTAHRGDGVGLRFECRHSLCGDPIAHEHGRDADRQRARQDRRQRHVDKYPAPQTHALAL